MLLANSTAGAQWAQEREQELKSQALALNVPIGVRLCASNYPPGEAPRYIVFRKEGNADIIRLPFFCGQWACPFCGHVNQAKLRQKLYQAALKGPLNAFLTITLPPREHRSSPKLREEWRNLSSGEYAERVLTEAQRKWTQLRREIKRQQSNFLYASVTEFHKDGTPHRHLLTNWEGSQRQIIELAKRAGFGYQGKLVKGEPEGMAKYLSKYMSKDAPRFPKGYRRYSLSKGLSEPKVGNSTADAYLCNRDGLRLPEGKLLEREPYSPMDQTVAGDQRRYLELYIANYNGVEWHGGEVIPDGNIQSLEVEQASLFEDMRFSFEAAKGLGQHS